jgi:hypothetical protein
LSVAPAIAVAIAPASLKVALLIPLIIAAELRVLVTVVVAMTDPAETVTDEKLLTLLPVEAANFTR